MNYEKTMEILEKYYEECVAHWKRQNSKIPELSAIADIHGLKHNPYSPNGAELDYFAKADFVDSKIPDQYRTK